MESTGSTRKSGCTAVLYVLTAVLILAVCAFVFIKYCWLVVHVVFADEPTEIFEELRPQAIKSAGPTEAVG